MREKLHVTIDWANGQTRLPTTTDPLDRPSDSFFPSFQVENSLFIHGDLLRPPPFPRLRQVKTFLGQMRKLCNKASKKKEEMTVKLLIHTIRHLSSNQICRSEQDEVNKKTKKKTAGSLLGDHFPIHAILPQFGIPF